MNSESFQKLKTIHTNADQKANNGDRYTKEQCIIITSTHNRDDGHEMVQQRKVKQRIAEIQAQMQQVSPEEAQMIGQQIQMINEQYSSSIMAQLANEFLQSIGMSGGGAPLVDIRQKELDLRDKELDIESQQFESKQNQRAEEKVMDTQLQLERMGVQKQIADDKLEVAIDRLKTNTDLKLFELENKIKGIL